MKTINKAGFTSSNFRANDFKHFYLQFEKDTQEECSQILEGVDCYLHRDRITIELESVNRVFQSLQSQ